jgi:hypothetical protein
MRHEEAYYKKKNCSVEHKLGEDCDWKASIKVVSKN